jgi:hypothetical protein
VNGGGASDEFFDLTGCGWEAAYARTYRARSSMVRAELITVWLEVRILPGPRVSLSSNVSLQ